MPCPRITLQTRQRQAQLGPNDGTMYPIGRNRPYASLRTNIARRSRAIGAIGAFDMTSRDCHLRGTRSDLKPLTLAVRTRSTIKTHQASKVHDSTLLNRTLTEIKTVHVVVRSPTRILCVIRCRRRLCSNRVAGRGPPPCSRML